ncbi:MAG TPA: hypothetical protein VFS22_06355 [Flavisolibacter sp.]|nr:hypothetical protein [Flavisolibacter sp.]
MKSLALAALSFSFLIQAHAQSGDERQYPSNTEVVTPLHKSSFNNNNQCPERRQGGNPQMVNGYLVFNGSMDGNRQVDPQIAVGGGYILHGTNSGLIIYDKKGEYVQGVSQKCFNNGIDPKMFFDIHNKVFVFDLWWYYDSAKTKPVNISVSETSNPTGGWNTYPVSRTREVDGGGIGYSKKWIGYSYPGGEENTFVMRMADAIAGKPATVYHFKGSLGHPVFTQDAIDDLYFFTIEKGDFIIRKLSEDAKGQPYAEVVARQPHGLKYIQYPPQSPQKGTEQKVSSGDRNPKNLVYQSGSIWFSQAVNANGRSAVQWHQVNATTGKIIQTGLISSDTTNYIQTTIAVNKNNDVLVGFQEVNENSFISPRFAYRYSTDKPGTVREIIRAGEGRGAADGVAWGDYSGSMIDGDNLTDLWTIQSIANEKGRGETVIVKVPFSANKKNRKPASKAVR